MIFMVGLIFRMYICFLLNYNSAFSRSKIFLVGKIISAFSGKDCHNLNTAGHCKMCVSKLKTSVLCCIGRGFGKLKGLSHRRAIECQKNSLTSLASYGGLFLSAHEICLLRTPKSWSDHSVFHFNVGADSYLTHPHEEVL